VNPTWPDASTVVRVLFPVSFLASGPRQTALLVKHVGTLKGDVAKGRSGPFRARNPMTSMARTAVVPEAASTGALSPK
jgi:hypothetical protein